MAVDRKLNINADRVSRKTKLWKRVAAMLCIAAVFATAYALILPAITMESETYCGMEAHIHDESCYESVLTCMLSEDEPHLHGESCYQTTETLTCTLAETQAHNHIESCVSSEPVLVCELDETEGHIHDDICKEMVLTCGIEESDEHAHQESCYTEQTVCGLEEVHRHDENCYAIEECYSCGFEETYGHTHTTECYCVIRELICTAEENGETAHKHNESCYSKNLLCQKEEHEHTLVCYSNPEADLETANDWESTLPETLSGTYVDDVIAIAKSQLGYTESTANYVVDEAGEVKGYTRYGEWYGIPYGDWCAMFVSFCLDYAGVEDFPLDASCPNWVSRLTELGNYHLPSVHTPSVGDVIFFDWDADLDSDHVGIVAEYISATDESPAVLRTIEGNSGNTVQYVRYDPADPTIMGYASLPKLNEAMDPISQEAGMLLYFDADHSAYQISSHLIDEYPAQAFALIPVEYKDIRWAPVTVNWSAETEANYAVAYPLNSDAEIVPDGTEYSAYMIQDVPAYAENQAVLSGIISHAYPFISADEMKMQLAEACNRGEIAADLSCCTEADYLAAVQLAIWDATGVPGAFDTVSMSQLPEGNDRTIHPLEALGHTKAEDVSGHVMMIRDWLLTQAGYEKIQVISHYSVVTRRDDGLFDLSVTTVLDRSLEENEVIYGTFITGEKSNSFTVTEVPGGTFSAQMTGLTEAEVLSAEIYLDVHYTHMQVFVYDAATAEDMIGGQMKDSSYEISLPISVETTSVEVNKSWTNGIEGAEITEVQLYADGIKYCAPVVLSAENGWSYLWDGLLKYSDEDVLINYTVEEVPIPGYYSQTSTGVNALLNADHFSAGEVYVICRSDTDGFAAAADCSANGEFILEWACGIDPADRNSVPETALWVADDVYNDGFSAYLRNVVTGNLLSMDDYGSVVLYGEIGDSDAGCSLSYGESADLLTLYRYPKGENTVAIVNTIAEEFMNIAVSVSWEGRGIGSYPESAEAVLLQNGVQYGASVTLNEENSWKWEWTELPVLFGTETFTYTVEETEIRDYTAEISESISEDGTLSIEIINTWTPRYTAVMLSKEDAIDPDIRLQGARFKLYQASDANTEGSVLIPNTENMYGLLWGELRTDENGIFKLDRLIVGEKYYLVETAAPTGYMMLSVPVVFTVTDDDDGNIDLTVLDEGYAATADKDEEDGTLFMHIRTGKQYIIPETGGFGTKILYAAGAILVIGAVILLVSRRYKR